PYRTWRQDNCEEIYSHLDAVELITSRMKNHGGKAKKTDRARHAGSAETGHQGQISGCLQEFDPDSQRNVQKVNERDEQRIGRRPNEGSPTVFGAPIPMLRRVEKPKRVVFGGAPVNLLRVNEPEFNKDEKDKCEGKGIPAQDRFGLVCCAAGQVH